eukprot:3105631-Rhodomonas_salina.2
MCIRDSSISPLQGVRITERTFAERFASRATGLPRRCPGLSYRIVLWQDERIRDEEVQSAMPCPRSGTDTAVMHITRCAISGTEMGGMQRAFTTRRCLKWVQHPTSPLATAPNDWLSCHAFAMPCPVLRWAMRYAISRTDVGHAATRHGWYVATAPLGTE